MPGKEHVGLEKDESCRIGFLRISASLAQQCLSGQDKSPTPGSEQASGCPWKADPWSDAGPEWDRREQGRNMADERWCHERRHNEDKSWIPESAITPCD